MWGLEITSNSLQGYPGTGAARAALAAPGGRMKTSGRTTWDRLFQLQGRQHNLPARVSSAVTGCWAGGREGRWFSPSWEGYEQGLETLLLVWTL